MTPCDRRVPYFRPHDHEFCEIHKHVDIAPSFVDRILSLRVAWKPAGLEQIELMNLLDDICGPIDGQSWVQKQINVLEQIAQTESIKHHVRFLRARLAKSGNMPTMESTELLRGGALMVVEGSLITGGFRHQALQNRNPL